MEIKNTDMNPNTLQVVSGQGNSEAFITMEYTSAMKGTSIIIKLG